MQQRLSSLDIAHQIEMMEIVARYARAGGGGVAVMHDLNLTAVYADHVVILREGQVCAAGTLGDVLTDAVLSDVYGCKVRVGVAPEDRRPFILPHCATLARDLAVNEKPYSCASKPM